MLKVDNFHHFLFEMAGELENTTASHKGNRLSDCLQHFAFVNFVST